ncbi:hypothetical protein QBC34DRAFT_428857 [Podospora aff. communis PSN243]|uniref:Cyanovirin-N domain-containing protein n=1 Tax=Podospora aff. communis PSN243 TaxID=3040156 RepID=A0AAV9GEP6_9PEZI|nr:hypothetical protein QBC34DRAFT_428857 [Podospora aff. communis PSN243]
MHLATTLAALVAFGTSIGTSASPIEFEARQLFPGNGSISLYSEQGCRASDVLVEDVAIVTGCNALTTPAASVRFNGGIQTYGDTSCGYSSLNGYLKTSTCATQISDSKIRSVAMIPMTPF